MKKKVLSEIIQNNEKLTFILEILDKGENPSLFQEEAATMLPQFFSSESYNEKIQLLKQLLQKINTNPNLKAKLINQKNIFLLEKLEKKLMSNKTSNLEKMNTLTNIKQAHFTLKEETIKDLLIKPNSVNLKNYLLSCFADQISYQTYKDIIFFTRDQHLKELVVKLCPPAKIPLSLLNKILLNKKEDSALKLLILSKYGHKINNTILQKILVTPAETKNIRLEAARKIASQTNLNLKFLLKIFFDQQTPINFKSELTKIFQIQFPHYVFRKYMLSTQIPLKDKYQILNILYSKLKDFNRDGTINMLFLIMQDYLNTPILILKSKALDLKFINKIIKIDTLNTKTKNYILETYPDLLTPQKLQKLLNLQIQNHKLPINYRTKMLLDFPQSNTLSQVFHLLKSIKEPLYFKIRLLINHYTEILNATDFCILENILLSPAQDLKLKQKIIYLFYEKISNQTLFKWLLQKNQDINSIYVQNLISKIIKDPFRSQLITKLLTSKHYKTIDLILKTHLKKLPSFLLENLILDPDYPLYLKENILNQKSLKHNFNQNGILDIIFADPKENPALRLLIYKHCAQYLTPNIIQQVKTTPSEKKAFLKKLT